MDTAQQVEEVTALLIFIAAAAVAVYIAGRGWHAAKHLQSGAVLFSLGLWILLLWALRDVWHYGLFGMAFDLRLWLLGVLLYVLYRRRRGPSQRTN